MGREDNRMTNTVFSKHDLTWYQGEYVGGNGMEKNLIKTKHWQNAQSSKSMLMYSLNRCQPQNSLELTPLFYLKAQWDIWLREKLHLVNCLHCRHLRGPEVNPGTHLGKVRHGNLHLLLLHCWGGWGRRILSPWPASLAELANLGSYWGDWLLRNKPKIEWCPYFIHIHALAHTCTPIINMDICVLIECSKILAFIRVDI